MIRVNFWVLLLFVILIQRQTDADSDQFSELEKEMSCLERGVKSITELKHKNELRVGQCHVSGYYVFHVTSLGWSYL